MLVTVCGPVFPKVVSGSAVSIRAGLSWGPSVAITADVISTIASAAATAHNGARTTTTDTRSHPRVRPLRKSLANTANAHRSKADANTTAATSRRFKALFASTSHRVVLDPDAAWRRAGVPLEPGPSATFG
jgi:hypothetical protein